MQFIVIANWKMQKTYSESVEWCQIYCNQLSELLKQINLKFVLCPSFEAIQPINNLIQNSPIKLGAQNCSAYETGAYTGEISAISLKQSGCTYCIVGHSERRINFCEDNKLIAKKIDILLKNKIEPIICIGETSQEKWDGNTLEILKKQLKDFFEVFKKHPKSKIIIAYEPVWSIGTNVIPEINELDEIFNWLKNYISQMTENLTVKLVYGGSVNPKNISQLKAVKNIEGFLLGSSSLDFNSLETIINVLK